MPGPSCYVLNALSYAWDFTSCDFHFLTTGEVLFINAL